MFDPFDVLEAVGPDLDAARAKIETVRDRLETVVDAQAEELAEIDQLVCRLSRLVADLRRAEESISGQMIGA